MEIIIEICNQVSKAVFLCILGISGVFIGYIFRNCDNIISDAKRWTRILCYIAILIYVYYFAIAVLRKGEVVNDFGYIVLFVSCIQLMLPGRTTERSRKKSLQLSILIALICYGYGVLQLLFPRLIISNDLFASISIVLIGVCFNILGLYGTIQDTKRKADER